MAFHYFPYIAEEWSGKPPLHHTLHLTKQMELNFFIHTYLA